MSLKNHISMLFPAVALVAACSSTTNNPATPTTDGGVTDGSVSEAATGDGGGPVSGPENTRCTADGGTNQSIDPATCSTDGGAPMEDAGADDGGDGNDYGDTLNNAEGDDDDCKYHVKWTASPILEGTDVTFTVTVTERASAGPMRPLPGEGANGLYPVRAEVYLSDVHPAPNTTQTSTETATPGTYTVGPIRFDAPGQWTVRFHFHEMCIDGDTSPHGHAAFLVQVP